MFDPIIVERFLRKVDTSGGADACWPWMGYIREDGYGIAQDEKRRHRAHRMAYQIHNGPMPDELVTDHLCRNRACCNPEHLEAVTNKENILRGIGPTAQNAQKTHCPAGHEMTPDNLYIKNNWRVCRTCRLEEAARYRARKKAPHSPAQRDLADGASKE